MLALLQGVLMRTTLTLEDDVMAVARQRAQRERISLGEAVSRYVRDALRAQPQTAGAAPLRSRYSVLPVRDEIITTAHVRKLMDDEGV
jgi:hypothetical protein